MPSERDAALFLWENVSEPNIRELDTALVAALIGEAPTLEPSDFWGPHALALEQYRAHGRKGLIENRLTYWVAALIRAYNPDKRELARALHLTTRAAERRRLAAKALAQSAELEATLLALSLLR